MKNTLKHNRYLNIDIYIYFDLFKIKNILF